MKRLIAAAVLCCAFGIAPLTLPVASAQTTTVTASSISLGGVAISAGTVMFTPVNNQGVAIPFVTGGGGLNGPRAFPCTITSGAIYGTCTLPDSALTTPVNILYQAVITNTAVTPNVSFSELIVGLTGASWAFDQYAPPSSIVNVQSIIGYSGTTVPGTCVAPAFFTKTDTDSLYSCIAGSYVQVTTGGLSGEHVVSSSATPTFSALYRSNTITLATNVSSSTLAAGVGGQPMTMNVCQDGTGSRTFVFPANMHGAMTIGATLSTCSAQDFVYSANKSLWFATSAGVTGQ